MEEIRKVEGLAVEELEAQTAELLPDREAMQEVVIIAGSLAIAEQGAQSGFGQVQVNFLAEVPELPA